MIHLQTLHFVKKKLFKIANVAIIHNISQILVLPIISHLCRVIELLESIIMTHIVHIQKNKGKMKKIKKDLEHKG